MRRSLVAWAVLTAALALGALPGVAGSQTHGQARPIAAVAFQAVRLPATNDGSAQVIRPLDDVWKSAGAIDATSTLIEPGRLPVPASRPTVRQPVPRAGVIHPTPKPTAKSTPKPNPKPAATTRARAATTGALGSPPTGGFKRVMSGLASWYDNGTTAMRLPRGTRVKICGPRGCVTRTVRDWGPASYLGNRIADLTPGDFVRISGHSLGAGLVKVTVYIY